MFPKETIHCLMAASNGTTLDTTKLGENGNDIRDTILIAQFMR
jgi:hypothetical protein